MISVIWMCLFLSEKATAPHSSTLDWKIPWMEEPGGLQSMGLLRAGHDWATSLSLFTLMHWRRKWQPTPVFLPGESQGWGSLVGCHLWGHRVEHDWSDLAAASVQKTMRLFVIKTRCTQVLSNSEVTYLKEGRETFIVKFLCLRLVIAFTFSHKSKKSIFEHFSNKMQQNHNQHFCP